MARRILLINGPNLNLLGKREPHIYGHTSLSDVENQARTQLASLSSNQDQEFTLEAFQSNHEGAIVDRIQQAAGWGPLAEAKGPVDSSSSSCFQKVAAIIINPGAYTHTSVAIRDALAGVDIPFIEVHISNVHARESFRHHSYLSEKATAVIAGLGVFGYQAAIEFVVKHLKFKD
ncbi:Dehydroquinase [Coniella lustricola]|uniref:Catabolic 3-dehydroquinase n=1 Tax=Coniella lustricola TaxID=2025994 RepID=A0A2T3AG63_9PEZI|nr:Dehydroquinase [Coniella lustricola]